MPLTSVASHGDDFWSPDLFPRGAESTLQPVQPPQSLLSFSEDSLTSGEEFSSVDHGSDNEIFRTTTMPNFTPEAFITDDVGDFNSLAPSITL